MNKECNVREICPFDLEKLAIKQDTFHQKCSPDDTLKKDGDFCSNVSYCCVICSTKGCDALNKERWGFKRTLLRMKLNAKST